MTEHNCKLFLGQEECDQCVDFQFKKSKLSWVSLSGWPRDGVGTRLAYLSISLSFLRWCFLSPCSIVSGCLLCYAGRCQWLPESPRFDITRGMPDRAMATLQRVARENGKPMPLGKLVDVVAEVIVCPMQCIALDRV